MKKATFLALLLIFVLASTSLSEITSQWRGENRNGIYNETGLLKTWPAEGPKMLWSTDILGEGFSSAAVTKNRVFITGMLNEQSTLFAFDLAGKLLWKTIYAKGWDTNFPGDRTTPTVIDDKIYVLSAHGDVVCINAGTGKKVWDLNIMSNFNGVNLRWGITESLASDGKNVFVTVGGADVLMVALNKDNGEIVWKAKGTGETTSYSSPVLVSHGGMNILLQMTQKSFIGIDASDGTLLWSEAHHTDWDVNPNTPVYIDGWVYVNSGYGTGSQMFKLAPNGSSVSKVWQNDLPDSQIGGTVTVDGYIYGSGQKNRGWHCVDWKTGKTMWSDREQVRKKGPIVSADGMLYLFTEGGDMVLARPNPEKFEVVSSFPITMGEAQYWAHPVIKEGRLYVRHGSALMVFDIKK